MTPKAELIGRIEDYVLDLMDAKEKLEFEKELELDQDLRDEVELHKTLRNAVLELDVLNLKDKLHQIDEEKSKEFTNGEFALIDDLDEIQELTSDLTFEELLDSFESLPKVHVYQHEKSNNENIHHFYKEQNGAKVNGHDEELNGFEMEEELEGLEEAILETDILNLRETLQHVAKSVEPQYSVEEIDDFLNGEMGDEILAEFETEMEQNSALMAEVEMHRELEAALEEVDVMDLRNEIRNIIESETSWNVSEKTIEDFIDGILEEDLLEEFHTELKENTDLMAEVALREQINSALVEKDILALRSSLKDARQRSEKNETKSIIMPRIDLKSTRFWRNSVAMIVVLVGLAGVLNLGLQSVDRTYDRYFETPAWASERSVSTTIDAIQNAKLRFQQEDFAATISLLNQINAPKNEAFLVDFYKGMSYQNLGQYENAVLAYNKVIEQGNNLFIEEAEWYKSLCYLKQNKKQDAKRELLAVIDRKGHYEKDAKAIIRKLKYSLK